MTDTPDEPKPPRIFKVKLSDEDMAELRRQMIEYHIGTGYQQSLTSTPVYDDRTELVRLRKQIADIKDAWVRVETAVNADIGYGSQWEQFYGDMEKSLDALSNAINRGDE